VLETHAASFWLGVYGTFPANPSFLADMSNTPIETSCEQDPYATVLIKSRLKTRMKLPSSQSNLQLGHKLQNWGEN